MSPVRLVVYFRHSLAGRGDDATGVKHHARDRVVVGVGVVDGAGSEVPDLEGHGFVSGVGGGKGSVNGDYVARWV